MPSIHVFVWLPAEKRFQIVEDRYQLSRVPERGELLSLGNDESGIAADYEILLVHHIGTGVAHQSKSVDAEVYAFRVFLPDALKALAPHPEREAAPWRSGAMPRKHPPNDV